MDLIDKLLQNILENLPLIAEEGEYKTKISRDELCRILEEQSLASHSVITAVISMVELQWTKAGLLDPFEIKLGNWQFLSFSSSLAARSWLEVMSDKESYWFPDGWWADQAKSEDQRKLLKTIEGLRIKAKSSQSQPIRQIYVAWAMIKLDKQLLFVEREDRERSGVPHFVLPGGRLNIHDLSNNTGGLDHSEYLKILQSPSSEDAINSLPHTLERELEEELGLESSEYSVGDVFKLNPYNKLEGAGENHGYTRYEISLFPISLTFKGFGRLARLDHVFSQNWFTLNEVAFAQKGNKQAFIEAWQEHHEGDENKIIKQLDELPESFIDSYQINEMIDIPVVHGDPFQYGPTGSNEREISINLEKEELELLLAMAWHRKHGNDLPIKVKKSISLSFFGWFKVKEKKLVELLVTLQKKLNSIELPLIESHDRNWFRISVLRENLFFGGDFFTYELKNIRPGGWEIKLFTSPRDSLLGELPNEVFSYPLHAEKMYKYLKSVEKEKEDEWIYKDQDNMMRKHLDPLVKKAGLRKFVRTSGGLREIICLPENP